MSTTTTPRFNTAEIPAADNHEDTPPQRNNPVRRYMLTGDQVNQATANLPDGQRSALRWLDTYCREKNITLKEVCGKIKKEGGGTYSDDSLYQALTGRRDGSVSILCKSIESFRSYVESEATIVQSGFIETSLTKKIFAVCGKALRRHKVSFIFGDSQIGKTTALRQYQQTRPHGEVIYLRMPTGGFMSRVIHSMGLAVGISGQDTIKDACRRILDAIDDRMLVIVDECHQAVRPDGHSRAVQSLEWLREVHDTTRCGMVLCGTNVLRDQMVAGYARKVLAQLWRRRLTPLQLPAVPTDGQLEAFAKVYGLPPAPKKDLQIVEVVDGKRHTLPGNPHALQTEVVKVDGLGVWICVLQEAVDLANERKKPVNWGHVLKAYELVKADGEISD